MFYLFEVAVGFVDLLVEGKGAIVFIYDFLEIGKLMTVHNTDKHRFILARVGALALYPCDTVAKNLGYILGNFLRVGGDYCEFICSLGTLDYIVADEGTNAKQ